MSSTAFQGFILAFEGPKEEAELFLWLAECFFCCRGIVGENGLLPQGKFSDRANGCLFLFGKDFRPLILLLVLASITCFLPSLDKRVDMRMAVGIAVHPNKRGQAFFEFGPRL